MSAPRRRDSGELGELDILVNNAGISWIADALEFPMDKWQRVMNLNVNGTFQLSAMAARVMKEQGGGKIINMCSIGAFGGDFPENVNSSSIRRVRAPF